MTDHAKSEMRKATALKYIANVFIGSVIIVSIFVSTLAIMNRRDINRLKNPERHNITDPGPDKVERPPDEDKIIDYHNAIQGN